MKLQEKILYCRKKASLSQEALAEQLGVSRQAVSKWETGEAVPEIGKLLTLANTFEVTTDWLLNDTAPIPEPTPFRPSSPSEVGGDPWSPGFQTYENDTAQHSQYKDTASSNTSETKNRNWIDSVPGMIGTLLRRYGWLFGVYLAIAGAGFTAIGGMARFLSKAMFRSSPFDNFSSDLFGGEVYIDANGQVISSGLSDFASNNPVAIMGLFIMILGILMLVTGIILALVLKRKSRN